jgi:hypothetical protein
VKDGKIFYSADTDADVAGELYKTDGSTIVPLGTGEFPPVFTYCPSGT